MVSVSKKPRARLERFTVRLPVEMLEAVDATLAQRVGNVSRNTWITEAVQEKLARNSLVNQQASERRED